MKERGETVERGRKCYETINGARLQKAACGPGEVLHSPEANSFERAGSAAQEDKSLTGTTREHTVILRQGTQDQA